MHICSSRSEFPTAVLGEAFNFGTETPLAVLAVVKQALDLMDEPDPALEAAVRGVSGIPA